jgi:hypothetical protein
MRQRQCTDELHAILKIGVKFQAIHLLQLRIASCVQQRVML